MKPIIITDERLCKNKKLSERFHAKSVDSQRKKNNFLTQQLHYASKTLLSQLQVQASGGTSWTYVMYKHQSIQFQYSLLPEVKVRGGSAGASPGCHRATAG